MKIIIGIIISIIIITNTTYVQCYDLFENDDSINKDECLLFAKYCENEIDQIQKKIKELESEIIKGTKKYSVEEINKLKEKLDEAYILLDRLTRH